MLCKLLLYEDNVKLRHSLVQLLEDEGSFEVAGNFGHCDNVVKELLGTDAQLIIMDLDMPGIGGIKGVTAAKSANPAVKIIIHTVFDDDDRIFECICAGADGYLLKNMLPSRLIESLRDVFAGEVAMSPLIARKVFAHFRKVNLPDKDPFNLTKREIEMLDLLVKGNSYKMIAEKSFISIDTVKRHLKNIYNKLHVNCGTEAVAIALKHKIVHQLP